MVVHENLPNIYTEIAAAVVAADNNDVLILTNVKDKQQHTTHTYHLMTEIIAMITILDVIQKKTIIVYDTLFNYSKSLHSLLDIFLCEYN
ncbi:hypothetical protein DERF_013071 [Dermatophagoides farinae]|uniref:Uncharacterized protein n=1 Tax=Dermatophagoides farinae TaxID=6954 RepID=A0A922HNR2_DERFA|nr:hypothetical protein DERF_013071 [Dermatophagoides farinae]